MIFETLNIKPCSCILHYINSALIEKPNMLTYSQYCDDGWSNLAMAKSIELT